MTTDPHKIRPGSLRLRALQTEAAQRTHTEKSCSQLAAPRVDKGPLADSIEELQRCLWKAREHTAAVTTDPHKIRPGSLRLRALQTEAAQHTHTQRNRVASCQHLGSKKDP